MQISEGNVYNFGSHLVFNNFLRYIITKKQEDFGYEEIVYAVKKQVQHGKYGKPLRSGNGTLYR